MADQKQTETTLKDVQETVTTETRLPEEKTGTFHYSLS